MRHVFVIVRALGIKLVLDVDAGDARTDELAHRAHGVQRLAETGAAIGDQGHGHRGCYVARDADLLIHGEQRFRCAPRTAGHEPTGIDSRKPQACDQPAADGVVG
jgi:hypothetical protein